MARPIRELVPGRLWFVTFRCFQAQHLMRPDPASVAIFGYWLTKALRKFPGIRCYSVAQMSNHGHGVLKDEDSSLSDFMEYFEGNLAREMNRLRGRRGTFFERRFKPIPILDDEALIERIKYTVSNPVKSKLVAHHSEWPGLVTFSGDPQKWCFNPRKPEDTSDGPNTLHLELAELPDFIDAEQLRREIDEHQAELFEANGRWALGAEAVLAQDPLSCPEHPKRSPAPPCHASTHEARDVFEEAWALVKAAYRRASDLWLSGDFTAVFPPYTFRPQVFFAGT